MARTRSTGKNQNLVANEASSSRKRSKTCAPWSDIDHDVLNIVMMQLGVVDFLSFRGVCKSWRSLSLFKRDTFMASSPPMSMTISTDANENICCNLEDFEGRKFKKILHWFFGGGEFIGVTCGYLIFFTKETRDYWLVNPITRHQLHFPHFLFDYHLCSYNRAILVFSASISRWLFVVVCRGKIWFCIEGKGVWKHAPYSVYISDIYAFKGKVYTLAYDIDNPLLHKQSRLCELRLNPEPKFTLLETRNPLSFHFIGPGMFVSSCDNLYVMDCNVKSLRELDDGEMKWVVPFEKTVEEYAFFLSHLTHAVVAVKPESWADPRSQAQARREYYLIHYTEKNRRYEFFKYEYVVLPSSMYEC